MRARVSIVFAVSAVLGGCAATNGATSSTLPGPPVGEFTPADARPHVPPPGSGDDEAGAADATATPDAAYADDVGGLIMRLFNEDDTVRIDGARELAALGRHAGPAVPYLRDCARQNDGESAGECAAAADYIEGLDEATAQR